MNRDLSFRDKHWPTKTGYVPVKLINDIKLRGIIMLLHRIHQEAKAKRNKLVVDDDSGIEMIMIKQKIVSIREWNTILRKEESYRKDHGLKIKDDYSDRFNDLAPNVLNHEHSR